MVQVFFFPPIDLSAKVSKISKVLLVLCGLLSLASSRAARSDRPTTGPYYPPDINISPLHPLQAKNLEASLR
ncbi:hypothetical protein F4806DRAFT_483298 [Annulohypoxylon nitens]|nr:hypothetical protein F4806DRAFT_483298 [Annulohypoxylon nitens]